MCGLPRAGKSFLSKHLSDFGYNVVSTDAIRQENNIAADDSSLTKHVYEIAASMASKYLLEGKTVIVDACCARKEYRDLILSTKNDIAGVISVLIVISVDFRLIVNRLNMIINKDGASVALGVNSLSAIKNIKAHFSWPNKHEMKCWDAVLQLESRESSYQFTNYISTKENEYINEILKQLFKSAGVLIS
jgi:hypothetical protein